MLPFMTFFSTAQHFGRGSRERSRGHIIPIMVGCAVAASAVALVAYLLWPTWGPEASSGPTRLPVRIGAALLKVPRPPIWIRSQRRSGPQERVDLSCTFPALEAPDAPKHVSADWVEEVIHP